MIGGKRDLASFEWELESCDDGQDAFRVALDGLTNNVFAGSFRAINEMNLLTHARARPMPTLKGKRKKPF